MIRHALPLLALVACADATTPDATNENEVITTVELTFTPVGGGDPRVATWDDPEADGSPVVDEVVLSDADDYALAVRFLDALAVPPEDLNDEIAAEGTAHQVFVTGSAVDGPAGTGEAPLVTHAYADADADGAPLGLAGTVTTDATGDGTLVVTLRHLPPAGDVPTKTADLAATVATGGFGAIPGSTDAQVTFELTVE